MWLKELKNRLVPSGYLNGDKNYRIMRLGYYELDMYLSYFAFPLFLCHCLEKRG